MRTWGDEAGDSPNAECVYLTATTDSPATAGVNWVDTYVTTTFQAGPGPAECISSRWNTSTPHSTMNVLMGDGSVHQASTGVSLATWRAIITPNGLDTVGSEW